MTKTTNYQLPEWEKTDRVQMKDFNDMTATLDTALKANADAIAAETTARVAGDALVKLVDLTLHRPERHRPERIPKADRLPASARQHQPMGIHSL